MKKSIIHQIATILIAGVWVVNGLFCKVLNLTPRHESIVARILGDAHAHVLISGGRRGQSDSSEDDLSLTELTIGVKIVRVSADYEELNGGVYPSSISDRGGVSGNL